MHHKYRKIFSEISFVHGKLKGEEAKEDFFLSRIFIVTISENLKMAFKFAVLILSIVVLVRCEKNLVSFSSKRN